MDGYLGRNQKRVDCIGQCAARETIETAGLGTGRGWAGDGVVFVPEPLVCARVVALFTVAGTRNLTKAASVSL